MALPKSRKGKRGHYVLVPKNAKPGQVVADTKKMKALPVTTNLREALAFTTRGSGGKYFTRNPNLRRHYVLQEIG